MNVVSGEIAWSAKCLGEGMTSIPRTHGRKVRCGGAPLSRQFQGGRDRWLTAYLVSSRPVRDSWEGGREEEKTDYENKPKKPQPCLFFGLHMHVHACAFSPPCIYLWIRTYIQIHTKHALLLLISFPGFMSLFCGVRDRKGLTDAKLACSL